MISFQLVYFCENLIFKRGHILRSWELGHQYASVQGNDSTRNIHNISKLQMRRGTSGLLHPPYYHPHRIRSGPLQTNPSWEFLFPDLEVTPAQTDYAQHHSKNKTPSGLLTFTSWHKWLGDQDKWCPMDYWQGLFPLKIKPTIISF